MTPLDREAQELAQAYRDEGTVAFIIRTTPDGNVRFIGPHLPPALVGKMLRAAADGYESAIKPRAVQ